MTERARSLEDSNQLITEGRSSGNGYYLSARQYESGDAEIVAIKMGPDDRFKGGGAKRKNKAKSAMDERTLNESIRRARTTVRRKALTLLPDRMLTLTFRENLEDIDKAWSVFKYFCRLMRFRYGDRFCYIAVPEYQERGAVHFHLAIKGYYDVKIVRLLWRRAVGQLDGNIDITSPRRACRKNSWNPKRIAAYLSKYITKSETVDFNRRRFSSGGDIQIPEPIKGWVCVGVPIYAICRQVLDRLSRKKLAEHWEIDTFFNVTYLST